VVKEEWILSAYIRICIKRCEFLSDKMGNSHTQPPTYHEQLSPNQLIGQLKRLGCGSMTIDPPFCLGESLRQKLGQLGKIWFKVINWEKTSTSLRVEISVLLKNVDPVAVKILVLEHSNIIRFLGHEAIIHIYDTENINSSASLRLEKLIDTINWNRVYSEFGCLFEKTELISILIGMICMCRENAF
jgi:hypothetical protein